jgi:hypothetical protein
MRSRTLALAIAGGASAAVAGALVRLGRPRASSALTRLRVRRGPLARSPARPQPETFSWECGQDFRVTGSGRHRVYWLPDAPENDPILAGRCPSCDRPLPREQEARAA